MPLDKIRELTAGLKTQLGPIYKARFVRLQNATALYETNFDSADLGMTISVNAKNEIAGLLFTPYTEAKAIERNTPK